MGRERKWKKEYHSCAAKVNQHAALSPFSSRRFLHAPTSSFPPGKRGRFLLEKVLR
ncbi:hypothetical protein GEOBRER4_n0656 [Citrifermentans bremense]|uniref:Uncharacterized protein n=1 Tax=Citrifermentans bremense TaxID=60035 RepID=A0A7R7FRW1_9BACT|nr:hypothetical protein GEOBRER4_n0656 [Citrifermentans bremense]